MLDKRLACRRLALVFLSGISGISCIWLVQDRIVFSDILLFRHVHRQNSVLDNLVSDISRFETPHGQSFVCALSIASNSSTALVCLLASRYRPQDRLLWQSASAFRSRRYPCSCNQCRVVGLPDPACILQSGCTCLSSSVISANASRRVSKNAIFNGSHLTLACQ